MSLVARFRLTRKPLIYRLSAQSVLMEARCAFSLALPLIEGRVWNTTRRRADDQSLMVLMVWHVQGADTSLIMTHWTGFRFVCVCVCVCVVQMSHEPQNKEVGEQTASTPCVNIHAASLFPVAPAPTHTHTEAVTHPMALIHFFHNAPNQSPNSSGTDAVQPTKDIRIFALFVHISPIIICWDALKVRSIFSAASMSTPC